MVVTKRIIIHEALKGIGKGIESLTKVQMRINRSNAPGSEGEHFPIGGYLPPRYGEFGTMAENMKDGQPQPLETWPTVIEATEVLIGAAFVSAQEYVGERGSTRIHADIGTVANFWRQRADWGLDWTNAPKPRPNANKPSTRQALESLGEAPPMTAEASLGQLTRLADKVLGAPFTVGILYEAIADIP